MSDLNLKYSNVGSNSMNAKWGDMNAKWNETNVTNTKTRKEEDADLNKSIFKSYLDSLRTRSDEQAQKILKSLENSPADTIGKLFGSLQTNSSENVGKLFEGLKLNSAEEVTSILDKLKIEDKEKTDKTDEEKDTLLDKYLRKISENLSAENNALNEDSEAVSSSVQRMQDAFEPDEKTGEIDEEMAYRAADDFVKTYNKFADEISSAEKGAVAGKASFINNMLSAYENKLDKVGIERDDNGHLSVDREKLDKSTAKEREEVFGKKDSFADFIDGQAKQLQAYAQTDLYQRSGAYNEGGSIAQISYIVGSYFNMLG